MGDELIRSLQLSKICEHNLVSRQRRAKASCCDFELGPIELELRLWQPTPQARGNWWRMVDYSLA
jgi:hypothetical protein